MGPRETLRRVLWNGNISQVFFVSCTAISRDYYLLHNLVNDSIVQIGRPLLHFCQVSTPVRKSQHPKLWPLVMAVRLNTQAWNLSPATNVCVQEDGADTVYITAPSHRYHVCHTGETAITQPHTVQSFQDRNPPLLPVGCPATFTIQQLAHVRNQAPHTSSLCVISGVCMCACDQWCVRVRV